VKKTKEIWRGVRPDMLEKYYHSRGATACEEGRFDQAIRLMRKALTLDDQAYTRSHLSLAYEGKGSQKRAMEELTRAIGLAPTNPEYYLRRSALWQRMGDPNRAGEDWATAIGIDPNLRRLEEIRGALRKIEQSFSPNESTEEPERASPRDERLKAILARLRVSRLQRGQALSIESCPVNCPAYCCYFSKDLAVHGVLMGPWKLRAVREFLRKSHLDERDFIEKYIVTDETLRLKLIPPHLVISEKGQRAVFYPKTTAKRVGADLAQNLPLSRDYRRISWMTGESAACAFLGDRRCSIHGLASEPALSACKEFLCLTGFMFLALILLGVLTSEEVQRVDMARSNYVAVEAALLLAREVFEDRDLSDLELRLQGTIRQALEADKECDNVRLEDLVGRCEKIERMRTARLSAQLQLLRNKVTNFLGDEPALGASL
jgi:Flp pilus assembly protein TadD